MSEKLGPSFPEIEGEQIRPPKLETEKAALIARYFKCLGHVHSEASNRDFDRSESIYSLEEMIAYGESIGLEVIQFGEHSSDPGAPVKQSPDSEICQSLLLEAEEIAEINREKEEGIIALSGVETNIFYDADDQPIIDLPSEVLSQLDLVIASRHSIAREKEPEAIKESLLYAVRNPDIDVIGHPDRYTRRDGEQPQEYWDEYWAIWPEILEEMAKQDKAFEINLNNPPSEQLLKLAAEVGVDFFISFDTHDYFPLQRKKRPSGGMAGEALAKGQYSDEAWDAVKTHKQDYLSFGLDEETTKVLEKWIKELESLGVTPDRVVNSSRERLLEFLQSHGKKTKNLENLYRRHL